MLASLNRGPVWSCLALITVLLASTELSALQPPRPGELEAAAQAGELEARLERAKRLGNDRTDPRLVWRLRRNLMKAAGATDAQILNEIGNAPPTGWQGGLPSKGTPKTFVLLVDFPDYPRSASQTRQDIESKFFGDGDATYAPYESLRNYYKRSSYDQLTIQGTVFEWYRAQNTRQYYQNIGDGPGQEALMKEAILAADAAGHDFSQYDNDGDGYIDGFFIKWTGPDNGWANFWWAYQWSWHSTTFSIDGKSMGNYVWSWVADDPITGPYNAHTDIHETGHLIGLPDLYDYEPGNGPEGGVGYIDMMDANWGDHNCFSKYMLDWLAPTVVSSDSVTKQLNPSGTSKDCVLIMPGVTSSTLFGEFFMAQYRKRGAGNDPAAVNAEGYPAYPTDGLLIWHIDSRLNTAGTDFLYNNSDTSHKYVRLMEADGLEEISANGMADAGDFYVAPKTFSGATTPNSRSYSGAATGVTIDQLTAPGTTMSARFEVNGSAEITVVGSTLKSESCPSLNGAIDPFETVTLSILLGNIGISPTTSLTATLLPTGGVTAPGAPQNYGVLTAGGQSVARDFTFTSEGTCGGTITLSLQLKDGTTDLGTVTLTKVLGGPLVTASENFDGVTAPALPAGWTATASGAVQKWATRATTSDTSPNVAFAPDPKTVTDNILKSAPFSIQTSSARLNFRHRYVLEISGSGIGYDGGVLEVAVGQGAFVDVLDAGCTFETGGYNTTISTGYDNPLAGRKAWSGIKESFFTTAVNLPASMMGQNVTFRWRLGTDEIVAAEGWYVDSITLEDGFACCDPLAIIVDKNTLTVPEESTASFQVKLASQPTGDVVVTVSKQAGGDADLTVLSGAALTFSPSNWDVFQTVTLAAADDPDAIDGQANFVCQAPGLHDAVVIATEDDDNSYDFRVLPETVSVPESGTATFQVKLGAMPLSPLTVSVTRASGDADITVQSGATLAFDQSNWDAYQTVTLAAAEDADAAGQQASILLTSSGWPDKVVTAVEQDNDTLGIELSVSSLAIAEAAVGEFQVRLTAAPLGPLTVAISRATGDTSITVKSGSALTFGAANYNVWQTVTLSAEPDVDAADGTASIRINGAGMQTKYLQATEIDDDIIEIVLTTGSVSVGEGLTAGFPIKLGAQPVEDVSVTISLAGDSDISLLSSAPVVFTPNNWNVFQTVTLLGGQDDDVASGEALIRCSAPGMLDKFLTARESDDDALAIVPSVSSLKVAEMGTAFFTVKLAAQPSSPVQVNVEMVPGDPDVTLQSASTLVFTPAGPSAWNLPQPVIVAAARDLDTENGQSTVRLTGADLKLVEVTINEADDQVQPPVWYADADNDGAGDASVSVLAWAQPAGYVANSEDCDDVKATVHPAAVEACDNAIDDNCNGHINEGCDLDGDGVLDSDDQCPDTASGVAVDANGCPLPPPVVDSDGDQVPDDQDQCPNTPAGTQVASDGCPLPPPDADGDQVPDDQDQCPNTPAGTAVASDGCPLPPPDADDDGVADNQDQCPNTPAGTQVQSNGCPVVTPNPDDDPSDDDTDDDDAGDDDAGQDVPDDVDDNTTAPLPCGAGLAEAFVGMLFCLTLLHRRKGL